MDGTESTQSSALAQRAQAFALEKERRDKMLIIRKNFKEPDVERDRPPEWLHLLREKKRTLSESESAEVGESRWMSCLERQQWALERNMQNSSTVTESRTSAGGIKKGGPEYMSTWLRQLHSEI
jgi:hypothetical protein